MGNKVIILLVVFVIIIGSVFSLLVRRQLEAADSVTYLHQEHQAKQLANSYAQEGIVRLRDNADKGKPYNHDIPSYISIGQIDEFYTVTAVATVDGVTYQTNVMLELIPGAPGRFEPASQEQFFLLTQNTIELIRPHPNFNSALFEHGHNIKNNLPFNRLSEYQNIIYNNRPMRFANTSGNTINTSLILYSTDDIYLHGTFETLPGVEVILISEKKIIGGKKADNNITNPEAGAVIGHGVRLYSKGGLGTEGNGSLSVKEGGSITTLTTSHPIYSNQIPQALIDLIDSSGKTGTNDQPGKYMSWHSRPISMN